MATLPENTAAAEKGDKNETENTSLYFHYNSIYVKVCN